ncbi:MAG: PilZ domain-containing protein [Leptonema sp. (in: Bacteria)]|nr:PilZ domain-containing protein [Leptonema sp. (in: bacteria)]
MERRNSGRIRSKALSGFHVYLDSDVQIQGQLIDISETGLQFAITTINETDAVLEATAYTGFFIGSLIDDEVHFDSRILWLRKEGNTLLVGIEFFEPIELPSTVLALKMSEAE